jgi:hypothetical protein
LTRPPSIEHQTNLPMPWKWIVYSIFLLFLCLYPQFAEMPDIDFVKAYYPVARSIVEHGTFQYEYGGLKNIPIVGSLLAPFGLVNIQAAIWIFLIFELLCYFGAFIVASETFARSDKERWIMLFLFIISRPFYIVIFFGQLTPLAFLLLLLMIRSYLRGRKIATGILLTSVFLIKIPPGLLFLYFLKKKEYTIVTWGVIAYIAAWLLSIVVFGLQLHIDWFNYVIKLNIGTALLGYNNQTIFAFLLRHFKDYDAFNWYPIPFETLGYCIVVAGIVCTVAWLLKLMYSPTHESDKIQIEISMMICLFLMVFPLVWDHYYLFLIFPYFILIRNYRTQFSRRKWLIFWLSFIMVNPPVAVFYTPDTPNKFLNVVLMSSLLLGCAILLILLGKELRKKPCPVLSVASQE